MILQADSFEQLYVEIAKLKPHDRKHVMRCLQNRRRVMNRKMAAIGVATTKQESTGIDSTTFYQNGA